MHAIQNGYIPKRFFIKTLPQRETEGPSILCSKLKAFLMTFRLSEHGSAWAILYVMTFWSFSDDFPVEWTRFRVSDFVFFDLLKPFWWLSGRPNTVTVERFSLLGSYSLPEAFILQFRFTEHSHGWMVFAVYHVFVIPKSKFSTRYDTKAPKATPSFNFKTLRWKKNFQIF